MVNNSRRRTEPGHKNSFFLSLTPESKIPVVNDSRHIPGARWVGHHGEALIHLFALAMGHGISADLLGIEMYAFPTFAADIKSML